MKSAENLVGVISLMMALAIINAKATQHTFMTEAQKNA